MEGASTWKAINYFIYVPCMLINLSGERIRYERAI